MNDALRTSAKFFRRSAVRIWILAILYFPLKSRKYFYLCYTYLRLVDNYVDNPVNNKFGKIEFVENQIELIEFLQKREYTEDLFIMNQLKSKEEFLLYYFVEYCRRINNDKLIFEVKRSVESIWLDARRLLNGGIYSNKEFDLYIEKLSKPLFNIVYYFLFPSAKNLDEKKSIGNFIAYIAMFRDFFEDIEAGYINISKEDILKYNLDTANLKNDKNLCKWMEDKFTGLLNLMYEEITLLKSMHLKLKLFWLGPYLVVLNLLIRIKVYNYRFGIKFRKNLIKELNVLAQSFLFNLKIVLRLF